MFGTFDYFVQSKVKMQLVGMMHLSVETPLGASKIVSDGSLELRQNKPVLIDSLTRNIYDIDPLTDVNYEQFSIDEILENYNHRSERLEYNAQSIVQPMGSRFSTTLDININIPTS